MNQIIEELSKIDSATEQIILSADNEKEEYTTLNETRKKEYEDSLTEKMNQNTESYKTKVQTDNDNLLKQYRAETEAMLSKLDNAYEQDHNKWANQILQKLITD